MSDLRETLHRRAATTTDLDPAVRLAAVRRRVERTRRRRAASGVVAVAVLVLAVAGGTALVVPPHRDRVAPTRVVGRALPAATTSLGAVYKLADVAVGSHGALRFTVKASDTSRVVRWASATSQGRLVLSGTFANPAWHTAAGGFGDFVQIPAGVSGSLLLRQVGTTDPGDVALASYAFATAAPGVTVQGVTFRQTVDGHTLAGAAIGRAGRSSATGRIDSTYSGPVRLLVMCRARAGAAAEVTVGGSTIGSVGCQPAAPTGAIDVDVDGAAAAGGSLTTPVNLAEVHSLSVRLVDGQGHAAKARSGDRVAAAVYLDDTDGGLPTALDVDGHTWSLREVTTRRPRADRTRLQVTGSGRYLVHWDVPVGTGTLRIGSRSFPIGSGRDGRTFGDTEPGPGPRTVTLTYDQPPAGRARFGVYDLVH